MLYWYEGPTHTVLLYATPVATMTYECTQTSKDNYLQHVHSHNYISCNICVVIRTEPRGSTAVLIVFNYFLHNNIIHIPSMWPHISFLNFLTYSWIAESVLFAQPRLWQAFPKKLKYLHTRLDFTDHFLLMRSL